MVVVTTPQLWQSRQSESHLLLARRVVELRNVEGLSFVAIAQKLNNDGVLSPRGMPFYQQLVFSMYKKWTLRGLREQRLVRVTLEDVSVTPVS